MTACRKEEIALDFDSVEYRGIHIYFNRDIFQELSSQAVTGLDFRLWSVELKEIGSPFNRKYSVKDLLFGNVSHSLSLAWIFLNVKPEECVDYPNT